ncbi:MAG: glycosyltransferase family 1 protein [Patescibacteria group bacterium]
MNIGIDLRALAGGSVSGVTVYLHSLLLELFRLDDRNRYFLWFNSAKEKVPALDLPHSPRFKLIHTRHSNRKLNLELSLRGKPFLDRLILDTEERKNEKLDLFWLPDPRPVALSPDCKLVATIHDLSPELYQQFFSLKTRFWHKLLRMKHIAERADLLITPSQATAGDLERLWNIAADKIAVTPLGVADDLQRTNPGKIRQKYNLPEKFVLSLSTLEPRKNLGILIKAFTDLKQEIDLPHELVLAGKRDSKIFANPETGNWKLATGGRIHFPGFIAESDKAALLSAADAFCFPSIYEGFGLPALEAMKVGTPLLAADIPAIREVCGDAAKLIPPRNVDAWRVALQKVLTDSELREEMSRAGIRRAQKFGWKRTAKETLKAFEKVGKP